MDSAESTRPDVRRAIAGVIAALLTGVLLAGFYVAAHQDIGEAQAPPGRQCLTINNLRVCGVGVADFGGGVRAVVGSLTMGPVNGPDVLAIDDTVDLGFGDPVPLLATFIDQGNGIQYAAFGKYRFISDTQSLLENAPANPTKLLEMLCVDPTGLRVFAPVSPGECGGNKPDRLFPEQAIRNSTILVPFLSRALVLTDWVVLDTYDQSKQLMDVEFNLNAKEFRATFPLKPILKDNDENPDWTINVAMIFSSTGQLKSAIVQDVEVTWGSTRIDLQNISISQNKFTAGAAIVSKVKNQDLFLAGVEAGLEVDEIFRITGLQYVSQTFRVGTVEVPIKDLKLGTNFSFRNNRIGVGVDPTLKKGVFFISGTMVVGPLQEVDPELETNVNVSLRLSAGIYTDTSGTKCCKPSAVATVQDFDLKTKIGVFKLEGVQLVLSAAQDFYGLQANSVKFQWKSALGGNTSAGFNLFRMGYSRNQAFIFSIAGGNFTPPAIQNGVFQGSSLSATTSQLISTTVVVTITGSLQVKLPGGGKDLVNSNNSVNPVVTVLIRLGKNVKKECPANSPAGVCAKHFEGRLTGFGFSLAGFVVKVTNPSFPDTGGFQAATATLGLPLFLNSPLTTTVQNLRVAGDRAVQIDGGQVNIPPLEFAGHNFVGMRGGFLTENRVNPSTGQTEKYYKFTGGASLAIPGLDPTSGQKFSVNVEVTTKPSDGSLDELDVDVSYQTRPGIPLAATGFEIVRFSGGFTLKPQSQIIISVGVGTETTVRFPIPVVGTIPLASIDGQAEFTINTAPDPNTYRLELGAQLKLLIFQVAQATVEMGDGAGFRACPAGHTGPTSSCPRGKGFHANLTIEALFIHGSGDIRIGKINGNTRIAGSASLIYGLEKGQFGFSKPPFDISIGVTAQCCEFNIPGSTNARGLLATLHIPGPWDPTAFVDFQKSIGQSGFVKLVDPDDYALISSDEVEESLKKGLPGFRRDIRSFRSFAADGITAVEVTQRTDTVPVNIPPNTDTVLFGIHFSGTVTPGDPLSPTIKLKLPASRGNIILTPSSNLAAFNGLYNADYSPVLTKGNDLVFILSGLAAASQETFDLIIENAEKADPYTVVSFGSNAAPTLSNVFGNCGGATISGLLVQCNNIAAGGQVTVSWTAADPDGPDTKVSVWYAQAPTATTTVTASAADLGNLYPIVENRPVGAGSVVWNLDGVPGGNYLIVVRVDDGRHPSTVEIAKKTLTTQALVVNVTDNKPPAVPTGLAAVPGPKEVTVNWNQNTESDLAGYQLGFGTVNDPTQFLYTRDMGAKEDSTGVLGKTDAKIWGLQDNVTIFYGIRAYDLTGNFSDWSPLVATKPWDLAPNQFSPAIDSVNKGRTNIEVLFLSPSGMNAASFTGNVILNGPNGPIAGTVAPILDLEGVEVIGVRFTPTGGVVTESTVTVVVKGGAGGVKTASGAGMNADFSWSFVLQPIQSFLPLSVRGATPGW